MLRNMGRTYWLVSIGVDRFPGPEKGSYQLDAARGRANHYISATSQ